MPSKTIRWALTVAFAAAVTGCDSQPAPNADAAKGGPPPPSTTATAKEKKKAGSAPASAVD